MRSGIVGWIVVALVGCTGADPDTGEEDECLASLEDWCGDPPCETLTVADVTPAGTCDTYTVAHDGTDASYVTHVWYFDGSGALAAVHVYSDDPDGNCTSNWYGEHVVCAETCDLGDRTDLLECE